MRVLLLLLFVFGSSPLLALELDGQTEFAQRLQMNSSVSARVESVLVTTGQRVAAGELLMRLETTVLQARVDMARAEAAALSPSLARRLTELEKAQELFDRDSLALVELQNAEQDYAIAQARLDAAEARLARAEYRLSQAEIRAPFSGVVLTVEATPGQYINTGVSDRTLLTLADNKTMHAIALIPLESWRDDLMHRRASVIYGQQNFSGRVTGVGQQITRGENNHPAALLQISFDTDGKLPAGLPVKIRLADE